MIQNVERTLTAMEAWVQQDLKSYRTLYDAEQCCTALRLHRLM